MERLVAGFGAIGVRHAAQPDAKVILLLRNPVDRAYSQYKAELFHGRRHLARSPYFQTFADYATTALDSFPAVPFPGSLAAQPLHTGIYVKAVQLWCERFGRENVHCILFDDFVRDTPAVYRQTLASAQERLQTGERAPGAMPWAQLKAELGMPE